MYGLIMYCFITHSAPYFVRILNDYTNVIDLALRIAKCPEPIIHSICALRPSDSHGLDEVVAGVANIVEEHVDFQVC